MPNRDGYLVTEGFGDSPMIGAWSAADWTATRTAHLSAAATGANPTPGELILVETTMNIPPWAVEADIFVTGAVRMYSTSGAGNTISMYPTFLYGGAAYTDMAWELVATTDWRIITASHAETISVTTATTSIQFQTRISNSGSVPTWYAPASVSAIVTFNKSTG